MRMYIFAIQLSWQSLLSLRECIKINITVQLLSETGNIIHWTPHCKNKRVTFNQIGLPQLQHQCQTMCIQADQLHCLIGTGSNQLTESRTVVSSVIDLLLRTLFNIEAATVVTLSVESYPFVFTVQSLQYFCFLQCRLRQ